MRLLLLCYLTLALLPGADPAPAPAGTWAAALDAHRPGISEATRTFNLQAWAPYAKAGDPEEAAFLDDATQALASRFYPSRLTWPTRDPRPAALTLAEHLPEDCSAARSYWSAVVLTITQGTPQQVGPLLRHAWDHLPVEASYQRMAVAARLCDLLGRKGGRLAEADQVWASRFAEAGIAALTSPVANDPVGRRLLSERLGQDLNEGGGYHQVVREALAKHLGDPGIHPGLAAAVHGRIAITEAWMSRGSGWANTVTEDGWKGFRTKLAEARTALEAGYAVDPGNVDLCASMIVVCMGQGAPDEESYRWFARAMAAEPEHRTAWNAILETRKPRWGGSYDAMLALGQEVLTAQCWDSRAIDFFPFTLMVISADQADAKGGKVEIWRDARVWPLVQTYVQGLRAHGRADDARLAEAGLAWRTGHRDVTVKLLAELGPETPEHAYGASLAWWAGLPVADLRKELAKPAKPKAEEETSW